jgi:MFS family permease
MDETRKDQLAGSQQPPPPPWYRWTVLVFISMAMFGNYYVYDSISPLADVLKEQLGFTDTNIGFLNAIYSFPNIFMVLIGGLIIDRIGTRKSTFIFAVLCLVGAIITAWSGTLTSMAAGRLVFGLGAESMIVAITTAIAKWFRGKELSFAFGLNLTLARLGSFAALNSPTWARNLYADWQMPLILAAVVSCFCVIGAVTYWILESRGQQRYHLGHEAEPDKVIFSQAFRFGRSYWYIVGLCITFYSAIFPFQTFAVKFFIEAHGTSRELGGFLSSMLMLFAMIFTPLFGLAVDRVGKRALFMMFGSALLIPVYLMMAYTNVSLYVPMAMMGIAFSLIPAVMWPAVAYVVDQSRLGTAYGLMTMIQNIGLAGFNTLIGWANDFAGASPENPEGYNLGLWIFSCLGLFGLLFSLLLRRREMSPEGHGLETITTSGASR